MLNEVNDTATGDGIDGRIRMKTIRLSSPPPCSMLRGQVKDTLLRQQTALVEALLTKIP